MRWPSVAQAIATHAAGDAVLAGIYGEAIRKEGTQDFAVPSLEYMLVADQLGELWQPHVVQWNQYTNTMDQLAASGQALGRLFNRERPRWIEGVFMWTYYVDGADLAGPEREGYYGHALRFRYVPVRTRLLPGRS